MKAEEGMNANQGKVYSDSCLTAALRSLPLCEHFTAVCTAQPTAACLLPWTLCTMPRQQGKKTNFPSTHSWKSSADFSNAKAATPQTTSSLLLEGESLIYPSGGFLQHFGGKGHFPCVFSLLSAIHPGPVFYPPPSTVPALESQASFT